MRKHPNIEKFWSVSVRQAINAVESGDCECFTAARIAFQRDARFLHLELPSGRRIRYPFARVYAGEYGKSFTFRDASGGRWEWYHVLKRHGAFGGLIAENAAPAGTPVRRARRVYELTDAGRQRFSELVADTGPHNYTDDGFGVHLAFFNRTPAEARMRILEGRRRQVEERREGLREAVARASSSLDRYTRQLHQLGLESSEREVNWLNELIAAERIAQSRAEQA